MPLPPEIVRNMYANPITSGDRMLWLLARRSPELRIMLPKQTKFRVLTVDGSTETIDGLKMLRIAVVGGAHDGKEGWLPRTQVHDLGRRGLTLRVGEMVGTLTGVAYGGYKTPFDDLDDKTFSSAFVEKRCRFCGGKRSAHRIFETDHAKNAVSKLYDRLAKVDTGRGRPFDKKFKFKQGGQVMLGVLVIKPDRIIAAYSGEADDQSDHHFSEECKALGFEPANHVKQGERLPRRDGTNSEAVAISVCAAVKMIAHVNRKYGKAELLAMSEIWFDPSVRHVKEYAGGMTVGPYYGNKQTIESCNSCRMVVPAMLCDPQLMDASAK